MNKLSLDPEWESQLVSEIEITYACKTNLSDKIEYLIDTYIDYRENHSFGEYDFTIIIEEEIEYERYELSYFLEEKFLEIKKELQSSLTIR